MTTFNRRDLMKLTGTAMLAALAAPKAIGAMASEPAKAKPVGDPLQYIDPELRPAAEQVLKFTADMPPLSMEGLPKLRAGGAAFAAPHLPEIPVEERTIPVGKGMPDVKIFIVNAKAGAKRPGILHMHGGGYIAGAAKWEIRYVQEVARDLDCIVVSVEYRLAPETTYVGSVEDNYAGLRWMYDHAAELGLDPDRIAVMGESAGGGHAARLAITARDRGEVPLVLQALIYPMLDDRTGSTIHPPAHIATVGWDGQANKFGWQSFLGQEPGVKGVPAAGVPARVEDLSGLAPAFVAVGGVDLFVQEDIAYATRLLEARVPTELLVVPGAFHGFDRVAPETYPARLFTTSKLNALRRAFGETLPAA
ncbi:alpha/beta hydrolase [Gimibacter soli]|uniref:Alpha/beta hydrolase n=1 Tax=Gimibacter soli TaxID=3024400 RepID=A0AAF0BGF7_9PROT|nr:alpha/beta hydrolase [Gimibacter soli]WCL53443.1 alpha/beta hydrolase [Gimibacter soli]